MFVGHLQYFCKDFIGDAFRFTILRDPIERAMSGWEHIQRSPNHPAHSLLEGVSDIKSALNNRQLRRHLSNAMTWFLGPRPQYDKYKTKEAAIRGAIQSFADQEMLDSAKECLEQLDFIGFTETLNQDTLKLFEVLGLEERAESDLVMKNSNPLKKVKSYRDSLDSETMELLLEANALDYELYEYAKQIAKEKWANGS